MKHLSFILSDELNDAEKLAEAYDIDSGVASAYLDSLQKHVYYVIEAGQELGVPEAQLSAHDTSKLDLEEFPAYAEQFHGEPDATAFASAWLHHIHWNPHHWQHWIFPDGFTPRVQSNVINGVVPMPKHYALEMIADWMGASKAYTDSWDMTEWLENNVRKIILHPDTADYVSKRLEGLNYNVKPSEFGSPYQAAFNFAH